MSGFLIILTASLVACCCALLGSFLILRKMAMIGDAISHSVLPGIVLAFLISGSRDSLFMLLGASVLGLITVFLIQSFNQSGVQSDASIGVVFTSLFAVGIVLVSVYTSQIDLDLDCVLYGEITYVPFQTLSIFGFMELPKALVIIGLTLLLSLIVIGLFYKQFKICSFDPALAAALGIPVLFFHYLLMGLVSMTTVASFESVGAILVVGMLIVPAATAYLLVESLGKMILVSMSIGVACSVLGYFVASWLDASIAGCMISVAGVLFCLALLLSPTHGVLWRNRRLRKLAVKEVG
jgi:manganese/zinc/iron transport system permease protein